MAEPVAAPTGELGTPAATAARHLPLAGTYNVRDVGGYRTADGGTIRWRTLLRADSLHRLDAEGRATLRAYGLGTVLDLRRPSESELAPNPFAPPAGDGDRTSQHGAEGGQDGARVAYVSLPLAADPARSGAAPRELLPLDVAYRRMLDERQSVVAGALRRLARPDAFPVMVHCTAGCSAWPVCRTRSSPRTTR
jgi:protein-tyrosine phosphatase